MRLKLIAIWFIWEGLSAVVDVALAFDEKLLLDFSVCKFFVGLGLLRLNPRSYDWAMLWITWDIAWNLVWIALIFFFSEPGTHEYEIFEIAVAEITPSVAIAIRILLTLFFSWQYAAMNSREIRLLFDRDRSSM